MLLLLNLLKGFSQAKSMMNSEQPEIPIGEFPRIPRNMAFVKFPREFPGFFSSLNLRFKT